MAICFVHTTMVLEQPVSLSKEVCLYMGTDWLKLMSVRGRPEVTSQSDIHPLVLVTARVSGLNLPSYELSTLLCCLVWPGNWMKCPLFIWMWMKGVLDPYATGHVQIDDPLVVS